MTPETRSRSEKAWERSRGAGFVRRWHDDSRRHVSTAHVDRFGYGDTTRANGRTYRYPGFVEKEGVRYLGQSVLFVRQALVAEIDGFLSHAGIDHEKTPATIG